MKVIFNTSVSFSNFSSASSYRVVEIPEELAKPYLDAGIATEISAEAPIGLKIVGPVPEEWLPIKEKVNDKKTQNAKKKNEKSVE